MAFQIRDLVSDVWLDEGDGFLFAGCVHPSCAKSSDDGGDGDGDDKGGKQGGHKGDSKPGDQKGPKPKYAPDAFDAGLALLQQQLRQSLAQEL